MYLCPHGMRHIALQACLRTKLHQRFRRLDHLHPMFLSPSRPSVTNCKSLHTTGGSLWKTVGSVCPNCLACLQAVWPRRLDLRWNETLVASRFCLAKSRELQQNRRMLDMGYPARCPVGVLKDQCAVQTQCFLAQAIWTCRMLRHQTYRKLLTRLIITGQGVT